MTKQNWEEKFDEIFSLESEVTDALKTFIYLNRKELVEEILADIPNEYERGVINLPMIKDQLRDKYLNN